jgi:hypothetical protein
MPLAAFVYQWQMQSLRVLTFAFQRLLMVRLSKKKMYIDLTTLKNLRRLLSGALRMLDAWIAQAEQEQKRRRVA